MTGRRPTRALLAGGALLALLTAGCGVRPSGVINGGPAPVGQSTGVGIYLVRHGELELTMRQSAARPAPAETLKLLVAGPDEAERDQGLTSEVPAGLLPVSTVTPTTDPPGLALTMSGAVTTLSATAVDQIVCTVTDAVAASGQGAVYSSVTLIGPDGTRGPRPCPMK
ncbi:hypothetical protein [Micromonospora sp. NPDC051006]|uniref:hypothetical protein n=1 Tax=Micromonospora sp. NPDC051006 TaxID=3364283 RepID=UPI00379316DD